MRSQVPATEAMSCEMMTTPQPSRSAASRNRREDVPRQGRVEARGRLVGEQDARPAGEREGDHHPLAHPAGELVRVGAEAPFGIPDPDLGEALARRAGQAAPGVMPCQRTSRSTSCRPTRRVGLRAPARVLEAQGRPAPPEERHLGPRCSR